MTSSEDTIKGRSAEVVTDQTLLQLSKGLAGAMANGAGMVELDAKTVQLMVKELASRRFSDHKDAEPGRPESGNDLKVRVNAYIDQRPGEWVSEIDLNHEMGMKPDHKSLRLIRAALRELDMAYVGLDKWREPIE